MKPVSGAAVLLSLGVAGCAPAGLVGPFAGTPPEAAAEQPATASAAAAAPRASTPASTPAAERRETALPATTIASLGDVREPGLWLRTPLVSTPMRGRVSDPATGRAVTLDLIPIEAAPGAGSRMSIAAYHALGLPLTALPELRVSAGG